MLILRLKTIVCMATMLVALLFSNLVFAQGPIPFTITNTSPFADSELYVGVVGIDPNNRHVWVNPRNGEVLPMNSSYNTLTGPSPNGNTGPGQNSKYADCFVKLTDIPNKTFTLPLIAGCRVFISKGSPLFLYFFGATGAPSGYAAPNPLNPNDPNNGILYEMIELTNNQFGFFGNPSRVDSYKYPMGLELFGEGYQKKVGEIKKHEEIVAAFKANVPSEFQGCVNDATGEITAPSKTPAFNPGGPHLNYLQSYIDQIWEKYKTTDLIFYAGHAGVFKGRVIGEQLEVVGQSGGFVGRTGRVQSRPTTQEALEGKGVLDRRLVDGDLDLVIQAQLTAAINRHVVDVTTPNPGEQNWHDASKFYQANPMNHYAKFWHLPGISIDNLSYGFAYDDVADQSPSLHSPKPTKVIAVFGGYAGTVQSTGTATVYQDCDFGGYSVGLSAGDYTMAQLTAKGIKNDDISSLKVQSGYEVVVYGDDSYGGTSATLSGDVSCLVANGFNDQISSIKVRSKATTGTSVLLEAEAFSSMFGIQTETTNDANGGSNVGYTDTGDWIAFTGVNFPATGSYVIEYRVASAVGTGKISADLNAGTTQLGELAVPNTGGWQNWRTISHTVNVSAGTHNFGVFIAGSGVNINWIKITSAAKSKRLGDEELALESAAMYVYPNPTAATLFFKSPAMEKASVKIVNVEGAVVYKGILSASGVDVSSLKTGTYQVILEKEGKKVVKRFTKN